MNAETRLIRIDAASAREYNDSISRPMKPKRYVSFDQLLGEIASGTCEPMALQSLADWLVQLENRLDLTARTELEKLARGKSLTQIAGALLDATDAGKIEAAAQFLAASESGCGCSGDEPPEPTPAQVEEAREYMIKSAAAMLVYNRGLRQRLLEFQCIAAPIS